MLSFFHRMTIYFLPLLIKLYYIWMKVLLMVRFKNNYDVLNLCFRDASDIYIQRNMNIEANPFITCTQTLLYFPFVLSKNIGEHAVWERKIKNACRHLWGKRRFMKSLPHVNTSSLSSAFTPIKFDWWYWGYKLLVLLA